MHWIESQEHSVIFDKSQCEGNQNFPTLELSFWDIHITLFNKKEDLERTFGPSPFPDQEIQIEEPASGRHLRTFALA